MRLNAALRISHRIFDVGQGLCLKLAYFLLLNHITIYALDAVLLLPGLDLFLDYLALMRKSY
jgi:hypothetical protein